MDNENALAKKEPLGEQSFIERLVSRAESLEDVKKVGMVIIESGFCPDHFKQSKDAVGAIMCIEAGKKLGLTWMQSLSDIYPVKGRIGIMGTAAKAVIFASGVLESWKEFTEGNYPDPEYKHIIVSKRKGLPEEFRSEFSVFDAATAGLMKKDIYTKYGKRMIGWRVLGFHASDYYQDILKGMKTVEELNDYDPMLINKNAGETKLMTAAGKEITVNQQKSVEKSESIAKNVNEAIDKANGGKHDIQDAEVVPEGTELRQLLTDEHLESMKDGVYVFASTYLPAAKYKIIEAFPRKKSQKQYREAILAHQDGKLDNWITEQMKGLKASESEPVASNTASEASAPTIENNAQGSNPGSGKNISTAEATASFMSQKKEQPAQGGLFGSPTQEETSEFEIKEIDATGKRHFPNALALSGRLKEIGVSDMEVQKLGFRNVDDFATKAKKEDVEILIHKNM